MPIRMSSHVNPGGIGIATLKEPVEFVHMATDDVPVAVRVVFMLAVDNPNKHLGKSRTSGSDPGREGTGENYVCKGSRMRLWKSSK